jgi:putative hydrolase of the HAD superfamily
MVVTTLCGMPSLKGVLFDFGGVLSREGFRGGLYAIARKNGLDPETFYLHASDVIYESGYITGRASEADFWETLRRDTGIRGTDADLTGEILSRFVLRPVVVDAVRSLRRKGYAVAIASDQVDWLDRLDERDRFYREFDHVFNSYRLGKGKRDPTVFDDMAHALKRAPGELLFLDDNEGNVERASSRGMFAMVVRDAEALAAELRYLPGLPGASP